MRRLDRALSCPGKRAAAVVLIAALTSTAYAVPALSENSDERQKSQLAADEARETVEHEVTRDWLNSPPLWQGNANGASEFDPDFGSPLSFSVDGRTAAVCNGKFVEVRDARTGKLVRKLGPHDFNTTLVEFSPDGKLVATALGANSAVEGAPDTDDRPKSYNVFLWNVVDGKLRYVLRGHGAEVIDVDFSPDGSRILCFERGNKARLWRTADGEFLASFDADVAFGNFGVTNIPPRTWARFGADRIVTVSNQALTHRDLSGNAIPPLYPLADFSHPIAQIAIAPGRLAVTGVIARNDPQFWTDWLAVNPPFEGANTGSGRVRHNPLLIPGEYSDLKSSYTQPLFSPDGTMLVVTRYAHSEGAPELVFFNTDESVFIMRRMEIGAGETKRLIAVHSPLDSTALRYCFSPDSRYLAFVAPHFAIIEMLPAALAKTRVLNWLPLRKAITYPPPSVSGKRGYVLSPDWSLVGVMEPIIVKDAGGFEVWDLRATIATKPEERSGD